MRLASVTLVNLPPFGEIAIPFADEDGPRATTVLLGSGGVGKTSFVAAVAATRPGNCSALPARASDEPPYALCEWLLGKDDPERPHTLAIATPTARIHADDQAEMLRRREQALFEKVAREGGFAFLVIPSTRWFSRQPIAFSAPARTIAKYDVRAPVIVEDASRCDLARETKQALAYAAIADALGERRATTFDFSLLGEAMLQAVNTAVGLAGFHYDGVDPVTFEPTFSSDSAHGVTFDGLPTRARHLVAMAALPVRTLWAAYPGQDPRESEGVVVVDEVELHQDLSVHGQLVDTLRSSLPGVQWVFTATSPLVTAGLSERDVFVLRRMPDQKRVELFSGADSRLH